MTSLNGLSAADLEPDDVAAAARRASGASGAFASPRASAVSLADSRMYCEHLTRTQARNFYYGLRLLPEPKRSDMFALYAYMRLIDDIADDDEGARTCEQRRGDLEAWRLVTQAVLNGDPQFAARAGHELWPAFADMARRHALPHALFDDVIAGQGQDLTPATFECFDQLHEYCYRVAGTVGLASIYVWGFDGADATRELAIQRGVAFQLTNILRDLREDASRGRTYLPRTDLRHAGVSEADIRDARVGDAFVELMRGQIARAESYYERSAALESRIAPDSRPTLVAMTEIYHGLLRKVAAAPERVLRERVSLSLFRKVLIGWRASRRR